MDHEKNLIAIKYLIAGINLAQACIDMACSVGLL